MTLDIWNNRKLKYNLIKDIKFNMYGFYTSLLKIIKTNINYKKL